jgi:hypothetical protein
VLMLFHSFGQGFAKTNNDLRSTFALMSAVGGETALIY